MMKRWLVGEFDKLARGIRSRCLQVWAYLFPSQS